MLENWSGMAWSAALPLLLVSGAWLTLRSRGFALRHLPWAVGAAFRPGGASGGTSPFSCLCTALATTVGTGNIAGVAFALTLGGPGALVWMWISAALGCAVKYAECALAVRYRRRSPNGDLLGGPMVTLSHLPRLGLTLGGLYAALEAFFALSSHSLVQSSAISDAMGQMLGLPAPVTAVLVGVLTLAVLSGGVRSVTDLSAAMVPAMLGLYLVGGAAVLLSHPCQTVLAVGALFRSAFDLRSMGAGAFAAMVRIGAARACFSNGSGTGSAAFSAALSSTDPVRQGLISTTADLWDTGVVCSVTGLSVLSSGAMGSDLTGSALVMEAYRTGLGQTGAWIVGACLILFAFSSLPGLAFQGEQALAFLTSAPAARRVYRTLFAMAAALGCLIPPGQALAAADLGNALLVLVELPSLWLLPCPMASPDLGKKHEKLPCVSPRKML